MGTIAAHGDRAMEFIWKHKGILAGGAALTAFLSNPQPYLSGAADITRVVGETAVKPVAATVTGAVKSAVAATGGALGPVIKDAAEATKRFALWVGGWLLIAILSFVLTIRLVARSGLLGKLVVKTGFKLAGQEIAGAIRKK